MKTTFPIARTPLRGLGERERECGREKERWNASYHSTTTFPFFLLCRWVGDGAVVSERTAMREMKMEARTRRQEAGRTKVHRGKSNHRGIPKMRR